MGTPCRDTLRDGARFVSDKLGAKIDFVCHEGPSLLFQIEVHKQHDVVDLFGYSTKGKITRKWRAPGQVQYITIEMPSETYCVNSLRIVCREALVGVDS